MSSNIIIPGGINIEYNKYNNTNTPDITYDNHKYYELLNKSDNINKSLELYNEAINLENTNINKAIELYNESIDYNPNYLNSYINCIKLYIKTNDIFNANRFIFKVFNLDKNNFHALFLYANLLNNQNNIKLANEYYNKAIKSFNNINNITNITNYIYSYAEFNYYNGKKSEAKKYFLDIINNNYNNCELEEDKLSFVYYYYADIIYNDNYFFKSNSIKNKNIAIDYYIKSADLGNINACIKIALIISNYKDYKLYNSTICKYFEKAINYNNISALALYAQYLYKYYNNIINSNNFELIYNIYKKYVDYIINNKLESKLYFIESNTSFFNNSNFIQINNTLIFNELYYLLKKNKSDDANYYLDLSIKLGDKTASKIQENNIKLNKKINYTYIDTFLYNYGKELYYYDKELYNILRIKK